MDNLIPAPLPYASATAAMDIMIRINSVHVLNNYFACPVMNFGFSSTTKLGTSSSAPTMFRNSTMARNRPIMAWNIKGEITQKKMPTVRVVDKYTTALPVVSMAFSMALFRSWKTPYSSLIRLNKYTPKSTPSPIPTEVTGRVLVVMVIGVGIAQKKPVAIMAKAMALDTMSGRMRIMPAMKLL